MCAQSCPIFCDPMNYNPPGSSVHEILQAKILAWIAISFSKRNYRKKVKSFSRVRPSATPWTVAHQGPPSMEFPRQEYWSGLPVPSSLKSLKTTLKGAQAGDTRTLPWPATLRCSAWRQSGRVLRARPWVCRRRRPADLEQRARELGLRDEGPKHAANTGRSLTVKSPRSNFRDAGSPGKDAHTPPGAGNCACALGPSVRRATEDKLHGRATSWVGVATSGGCVWVIKTEAGMCANISSTHKDQVWVTEESVKTEKRGLKRQRWRRKWQPTPVFLPGKSHGQRRLEGYRPWGGKESEVAEHACMYAGRRSNSKDTSCWRLSGKGF